LDTFRADRNGETLEALAARGRRYTRAYSPMPLTIPAHAALFSGRSPADLGLWRNAGGLTEAEITLAERFHDAGYVTAASVGAQVTTRRWGFAQGFDVYFDDLGG